MKVRKENAGVALMMALVLVAVLSIGGAALWKHLHGVLKAEKRLENQEIALYLADAGVEYAVAQLRLDRSFAATPHRDLGSGRFSVKAEAQEGNTVEITSIGAVGEVSAPRAQVTVHAVARFDASGTVTSLVWRRQRNEGGL